MSNLTKQQIAKIRLEVRNLVLQLLIKAYDGNLGKAQEMMEISEGNKECSL